MRLLVHLIASGLTVLALARICLWHACEAPLKSCSGVNNVSSFTFHPNGRLCRPSCQLCRLATPERSQFFRSLVDQVLNCGPRCYRIQITQNLASRHSSLSTFNAVSSIPTFAGTKCRLPLTDQFYEHIEEPCSSGIWKCRINLLVRTL